MKHVMSGILCGLILTAVGCGGGKQGPVTPPDEPTQMPTKDEKGKTVVPAQQKKDFSP